MDKNKIIKIVNRYSGNIGYSIPELNVRRQFRPKEPKEVPFLELERLSYMPGGMKILKDYLVITDKEALNELLPNVEPEYFYDEKQIINLFNNGTIDQFLDCLDYAPDGVLDMIKDLAVSLPLNDMSKRQAIKEKLNLDITRAIEIKNSKYDGEEDQNNEENKARGRRATLPVVDEAANTDNKRRTSSPNYKVVTK